MQQNDQFEKIFFRMNIFWTSNTKSEEKTKFLKTTRAEKEGNGYLWNTVTAFKGGEHPRL